MADADRYTYRVVWSEDDEEFVGTVAEFPSLSWLEEEQSAALSGITDLVAEVLEDMGKSGETPPPPLSERDFSGKFMVRTSPALHRRLAIEAHEQGVSLNMLVNQKISGSTKAELALPNVPDFDVAMSQLNSAIVAALPNPIDLTHFHFPNLAKGVSIGGAGDAAALAKIAELNYRGIAEVFERQRNASTL